MKKGIKIFGLLISLLMIVSGSTVLLHAEEAEPKLLRKETYEDNAPNYSYEYIYGEDEKLMQELYYSGDELKKTTAYTYDDAGYLQQMVVTEGDVQHVTQYECDAAGNIIKQYRISEDEEQITAWYEYVYDENNQQVEAIHYWGGALDNTTFYTYDDNGNQLSVEIHYDPDSQYRNYDSLFYRDEYEYDAAGHLLARYNVDENGGRELRESYEWTDDFHKRMYKSYDDDGALNYTETLTYDDSGTLLSEEILYDSTQVLRKTSYIYE